LIRGLVCGIEESTGRGTALDVVTRAVAVQCACAVLAPAEARLGLRLSASLVAFYRLLGRRRDLTSNQDHLIALNSLTVEDGLLIYRIEAQGCASWGVRVSDIGLADPPVVFCEGYRDGGPWRRFLESFSLAAVEMVLCEAIFAARWGVTTTAS
jgi:hypothetical protein